MKTETTVEELSEIIGVMLDTSAVQIRIIGKLKDEVNRLSLTLSMNALTGHAMLDRIEALEARVPKN